MTKGQRVSSPSTNQPPPATAGESGERGAQAGDDLADARDDTRQLREFIDLLETDLSVAQERAHALEVRVEELTQSSAHLTAERRDLQSRMEALTAELRVAQRERHASLNAAEAAQDRVAEAEARQQRLAAELEAVHAGGPQGVEALQARVEALTNAHDGMQREVIRTRQELSAHQREMAQLVAERDRLRVAAEQAEQARAALAVGLADAPKEMQALRAAKQERERRIVALDTQLRDAVVARDQLVEEAAAAQADLAAVTAAREQLEAQLAAERAERERIVAAVQADLAAATAAREQLEAQLGAERGERGRAAAAVQADLAAATAAREQLEAQLAAERGERERAAAAAQAELAAATAARQELEAALAAERAHHEEELAARVAQPVPAEAGRATPVAVPGEEEAAPSTDGDLLRQALDEQTADAALRAVAAEKIGRLAAEARRAPGPEEDVLVVGAVESADLARRLAERGVRAVAVGPAPDFAAPAPARRLSAVVINLAAPHAWEAVSRLAGGAGRPRVPLLAYAMGPEAANGVLVGAVEFFVAAEPAADLAAALTRLAPGARRVLAMKTGIDAMNRMRVQLSRARLLMAVGVDGRQVLETLPVVRPDAVIVHLSEHRLESFRALADLLAAAPSRPLPIMFVLDEAAQPDDIAFLRAGVKLLAARADRTPDGLVAGLAAALNPDRSAAVA